MNKIPKIKTPTAKQIKASFKNAKIYTLEEFRKLTNWK